MKPIKVLILDYSVDQFETSLIKSCIPKETELVSIAVQNGESFPIGLIDENFTHIIHSGSSLSINESAPFTSKAIEFIHSAKRQGIWQLGICYGHQLMCMALVGKYAVRSSPKGFEVGWKKVKFINRAAAIFGISEIEKVWQHHFDEVIELPSGSKLLASNTHSQIQAYINHHQRLLGTQFHPEFDQDKGNAFFRKDRVFIEKHHFKVDEILKEGPSFDSRKVFFEFFLGL